MEMIVEYSSSSTTRRASSSSSIETLIFNYVTSNFGILFSALDNFWALIISVLSTAVISLWGIKIVCSISHHQHVDESNGSPSVSFHHNHQDDDQMYTEESVPECVSEEEDIVIVSSCFSLFHDESAVKVDGNVKRKFTLHFAVENEMVNFNDELTAVTRCWNEVDVNDVTAHLKEGYGNYNGMSKWEKVLVTKDLGWYSNLDLTSLDGSAVKLWEKMRR